VTVAQATKMNNSMAGLKGYQAVYGKKLPFADFIERPSKKNLLQPKGTAYASFLPHRFEEEYAFDVSKGHVGLFDISSLTASHYTYNVGTAYGIASALTCWAAVCSLRPDWAWKMPLMERAVAIIWRLVYEGLGLSGYSAKAADFFKVLRCCSFGVGTDKETGNPQYQYALTNEGEYTMVFSDIAKAQKLKPLDAIDYLLDALGLPDVEEWRDALEVLVDFNYYRMKYSKLDRNDLDVTKYTSDDLDRISMIGVFRHLGRGYDPVTGKEVEEITEGGYNEFEETTSCFKEMATTSCYEYLVPKGTWLYRMYANGMNFMMESTETQINNAVENSLIASGF